MCWVSAAERVPFGSEGYNNDLDGSWAKGNMEVSERGVRSGLSRDCDSAARGNDRLENGLKGVKKKINILLKA